MTAAGWDSLRWRRCQARLAWPMGAPYQWGGAVGPRLGTRVIRGVPLQKASLPYRSLCQLKRDALLETELASSIAGCFSRKQGKESGARENQGWELHSQIFKRQKEVYQPHSG